MASLPGRWGCLWGGVAGDHVTTCLPFSRQPTLPWVSSLPTGLASIHQAIHPQLTFSSSVWFPTGVVIIKAIACLSPLRGSRGVQINRPVTPLWGDRLLSPD